MNPHDIGSIFSAETVASARAKQRETARRESERQAELAQENEQENAVVVVTNRYTVEQESALSAHQAVVVLVAADILAAFAAGLTTTLVDAPVSVVATTSLLTACFGLMVEATAALVLRSARYTRGQQPWFVVVPVVVTAGLAGVVGAVVSWVVALAVVVALVALSWLTVVVARMSWSLHNDLITKDVAETRVTKRAERTRRRDLAPSPTIPPAISAGELVVRTNANIAERGN